ncbi:MAG: hypothetical protein K6F32_06665 [Bacilli bacterium]|nr:hypothetical protein [Bacilli bacterium]
MKDKLLHTGHKKIYYRMRFGLIAVLSLLALAGISATPIAITYTIAMSNAAKAETAQKAYVPEVVPELTHYQG